MPAKSTVAFSHTYPAIAKAWDEYDHRSGKFDDLLYVRTYPAWKPTIAVVCFADAEDLCIAELRKNFDTGAWEVHSDGCGMIDDIKWMQKVRFSEEGDSWTMKDHPYMG